MFQRTVTLPFSRSFFCRIFSARNLSRREIYKLRADYKKAKGPGFSLREFHNRFVKQGGVPIKLIRRIMIPGDTAAVLD